MNKEIKIKLPDGYNDYTIEQTENGTIVKFIKKGETLDEILSDYCSWSNCNNDEDVAFPYIGYENFQPTKQRLELIAQYIAVADYLNGDWKPNDDTTKPKFYISWSYYINEFSTDYTYGDIHHIAYFRDKETAERTISLFGDEKLKIIFGVNE